MSCQKHDGPFWPSEPQRLLLACCQRQRADEARADLATWDRLRGSAVEAPSELDLSTQGLLPLLHARLSALGVAHPLVEAGRAGYLYARGRNAVLLRRLAGVLERLEAHGIPTIVLKGAALLGRCYEDVGARPMSDADVLVPTARAAEAFTLLREDGWKPFEPHLRPFAGSLLGSANLVDVKRRSLDLHWHVLKDCVADNADEDFWRAARPAEIEGRATRILDPADQLLQLLAHGTLHEPVPSLRWLADACLLVEHEGEGFDWSRLVEQARRRELVLVVRAALGYLREALSLPLPEAAWQALEASPVSHLERADIWLRTRDRSSWGVGVLPLAWVRYLRLCRTEQRWPSPVDFARRFGAEQHAAGMGQLAGLAARLGRERLEAISRAGSERSLAIAGARRLWRAPGRAAVTALLSPPARSLRRRGRLDAPLFVALCATYRRPRCISNVLAMWAAQDYRGPRLLLILDDGQTFDSQRHHDPRGASWEIVSLPSRLPTLGAKFSRMVELARQRGAERLALFDDDDVYFPGYLAAHAAVLDDSNEVSMATENLANCDLGEGRWARVNAVGYHHAAWAFTLAAYDRAGGYDPALNQECDIDLGGRLRATQLGVDDPWPPPRAPQFLYRWFTASRNSSAFEVDRLEPEAAPEAPIRGEVQPRLDDETVSYLLRYFGGALGNRAPRGPNSW